MERELFRVADSDSGYAGTDGLSGVVLILGIVPGETL